MSSSEPLPKRMRRATGVNGGNLQDFNVGNQGVSFSGYVPANDGGGVDIAAATNTKGSVVFPHLMTQRQQGTMSNIVMSDGTSVPIGNGSGKESLNSVVPSTFLKVDVSSMDQFGENYLGQAIFGYFDCAGALCQVITLQQFNAKARAENENRDQTLMQQAEMGMFGTPVLNKRRRAADVEYDNALNFGPFDLGSMPQVLNNIRFLGFCMMQTDMENLESGRDLTRSVDGGRTLSIITHGTSITNIPLYWGENLRVGDRLAFHLKRVNSGNCNTSQGASQMPFQIVPVVSRGQNTYYLTNERGLRKMKEQKEIFQASGVAGAGVTASSLVNPTRPSDTFGAEFTAEIHDPLAQDTVEFDSMGDAAYYGSKLCMATPVGASAPVRVAIPTLEAAFTYEVGIVEELTVIDHRRLPPALQNIIMNDPTGSSARASQYRARITMTKNMLHFPNISALENIDYYESSSHAQD